MNSSWESSHQWYDGIVGDRGHYYHQQLLPRAVELLDLRAGNALLDLGCGQGVLDRYLSDEILYVGVDLSPSLIESGKKRATASGRSFFYVGDITKPLTLRHPSFSHATLILVLQNVKEPVEVLKNAAQFLKPGGKLLIVLNHPCFRIPRQSSWGFDKDKKLQYRRIDRYMRPMTIPIQTSPGKKESSTTWSFHYPLSTYMQGVSQAGFMVTTMEEWCSDKKSSGPKAKLENFSRMEFPLFLAILAVIPK